MSCVNTWNTTIAPFAAKGPQNASHLFEVQTWLSNDGFMKKGEAFLLASWLGSGSTSTAEDDAAKEGFGDLDVDDVMEDLAHVCPKAAKDIEGWIDGKAAKISVQEKIQAKQDKAKVIKKITDTAEKTAETIGNVAETGAKSIASNVGSIAVIGLAVVGLFLWQRAKG